MKKVLMVILGVLLVVGLLAWYFVSFRLDGVIKAQIEEVGGRTLGTSVSVGSLNTDLKGGALTISDITVANPPGYKNENAFVLRGIEAVLDYQTLEVKRIIIDKPEIVIEEKAGQTNFTELMSGMESSPEPEEAAGDEPQPTLVIHHFRMNESRAAFESESLEHFSELEIDAVEVKNVKGTPAEVTDVIAKEVVDEIVSEAAKELLKAKASEKIDDIFNRD